MQPSSRSRRRIRVSLVALLTLLFAALADPAPADDAAPIHPTAKSVRPLGVGEGLPTLPVESLDGEAVDLSTLFRESGALLVFYRGGW